MFTRVKSLTSILAIAVLAAASIATPATAATLTLNFKADNGQVFTIHDKLSVEKDVFNQAVKVKHMVSGTVQSFPDATGAVWTKVIGSVGFSASYIQVPGTNRYMNTQMVTEINCISNQTVFAWSHTNPSEWFADACALHTNVKNASN